MRILKEAHKVYLIPKTELGDKSPDKEKASIIKLSHYKISEIESGLAVLSHRKTKKTILTEI